MRALGQLSQGSRSVSRALVGACRLGGTAIRVGPSARPELVTAARFHRVAPLVQLAYRETAPQLADLLQGDRLRAIAVHLQACGALHQLGAVLADLEWVTFKGPVFSELAHPAPGLRTYNDVDVLVAHSSLREATRRLLAADWRVADYQDMLRNQDVPGEMHWVSPGGVLIDLHWSMINMASRRRLFEVPTAELLQRRMPVTLGARDVWTLDPVDSLLHGCLHAALAGANKLLYLVDVDQLSRCITDWDAVATRAREWGAQAQVALVLGRARRVLGTSLPRDLDLRLQVPRSLRVLLAVTDWAAPVPEGRENAGLAKFVARATRPQSWATVRALGRNAMLGIKTRSRGAPESTGRRMQADVASLEVYLAGVEAAAGRLSTA